MEDERRILQTPLKRGKHQKAHRRISFNSENNTSCIHDRLNIVRALSAAAAIARAMEG